MGLFSIMFAGFGAGQAQVFGPQIGKGMKAAHRIYSIIDEESEIDPTLERVDDVLPERASFRGVIEFRNVWFRYPSRKSVWVLQNFSLTIRPNESVALVGQSGSGKSTVIQLIYRFYDPQRGSILIDGVDIRSYRVSALRQMFGLVQQEPLLFDYSLRENIAYGAPHASPQEVLAAARNANALEFIERLGAEEA